MHRFKTNILIRNNRLKKMQDNGIVVSYEILSDTDYIQELKTKLVEEAGECFNTPHSDNLKNEIADVLEVIDYLIEATNLNRDEILKIKAEKKEKIGGFDSKIKTHYLEIADDNLEELNYYLQRPEKYPEITK